MFVIKASPSKFTLPSAKISFDSCSLYDSFEEPEMASLRLCFDLFESDDSILWESVKSKRVNFVEIEPQIW